MTPVEDPGEVLRVDPDMIRLAVRQLEAMASASDELSTGQVRGDAAGAAAPAIAAIRELNGVLDRAGAHGIGLQRLAADTAEGLEELLARVLVVDESVVGAANAVSKSANRRGLR